MGSGRWGWIVPEGLWEIARPLLPPARVRPQGGGVADIDDQAVFAAIIYVLVSGYAWRALPPCFGASKSTVHRRFLIWSRAGVWGRLHQKVLELLAGQGLVDLSRAVLDSAHVRAKKGGELAGPSPVDRGKPGSKMHVLSDANGLPLRVGLSAANTHDSLGLKPMVAHFHIGHESHSDHSKPQRLHADKAYDVPDLRRWLHSQQIGVRIARKGVDSSERLGRRRWVIERTISWLTGYRRLSPRYERHPRNYLAFLGLAAALCCYKRLGKLTM
ncbi:IS5 family transposase [Streptomyces triticiradicis]|uniref:IS5 family transposase n=1 Tax=Streptomyces triticiradicis TaxID=2651189 RepID=A0A7J5D377_9ACTN|nr:IS5 family transposase [Streptomyces triticiradicis]KAB1977784.1 IS5 family transposase [Streptomyces triticiradicis]